MIKNNFQLSAQHARTLEYSVIKKNYRSPFPALNVKRRSEDIATDAVCCDIPAIDDGSTCAQLF